MRMTKKFSLAILTAERTNIIANFSGLTQSRDDLYQQLQDNNYFWDSKQGEWIKAPEPEPASEILKIRVWSSLEGVEQQARNIATSLKDRYQLIDKSKVYQNRPPQHADGRVYLTFMER